MLQKAYPPATLALEVLRSPHDLVWSEMRLQRDAARRRAIWAVRVREDDGAPRPWHCTYVHSIERRLVM